MTYELRGGEVLANTTTGGHQDGAEIAYLSDGRFVIVWRDASATGGDTSGRSIRAQIFNPDGSKAGAEFLVNTATAGDQNEPAVTALAGGGFAVAWTDTSSLGDGSGSSIKAQIYDNGGAKVGGEFVANTGTAQAQLTPSLASFADGGFVLAWTDGGSNSFDIKAQLFDSAGAKLGGEFIVNTQLSGFQVTPIVTVLADGRFVVVWESISIRGRIFNADGSAAGDEFVVSANTPGLKERPLVAALTGGGFAVTWTDHEESNATGGPGVLVRVYDAAGAALGPETTIHSEAKGSQSGPFITGLATGGFAVAWTDSSGLGADTSGNGVKAQLFDSAGARVGGEFLVNRTTAGSQFATGIAASPDGFTVAWADLSGVGGDASGSGIKFERFVLSPATESGDTIGGTEGEDHLQGLGGDDILSGLGGGDRIEGGEGDDSLDGGDGNDSLAGGAGVDRLVGGAGDDSLDGGDGQDWLDGGEGADTLLGGADGDMLQGGGGTDLLDGGAGNDQLNGGEGDDRLLHIADPAGGGWDLATGGAGSDTLVADYRALAVQVTMAAPSDDGFGGYSGSINAAGHQLAFSGIETFLLTGGSAADTMVGGSGHDSLTGLAGNDRLEGGGGNDLLDGGAGADTMIGGLGDDVYYTDAAGDQIAEAADSGNDTVWTSRSMTLGANLETLRGLGTTGLTLTGNGGANLITGTSGGDWIDGGAGADRMEGGSGNDTYVVDNEGDIVSDVPVFDPANPFASSIDTVRVAIASFSLVGTGAENAVGLLTSGQTLTGNSADNSLTGSAGDDRLDGGAGRDIMIGGAGNDIYVVDNALDNIGEAAGGGVDEVLIGLSQYTLPAEVENGTLTIAAFSTLYGNALDNVLRGTDESETFDGRGGADTMIGGLGGDTYYVDNAGDAVVEAPGNVGIWSDKVITSLAYYEIPVGVELLEGTSARQTLVGSAGDDWIISAGGGDTMIGRAGNDLYYVQAGDVVVELEGEGVDLVRTTLASYTLGDNVEELQGVSFSSGQTLTGNALDNRIIGTLLNNQGDVIDGGLGADTMIGWHGNDVYYVDNEGDVVTEQAGQGTDEVRTSLAAYSLFGTNIENLSATSDAAHDFRGSAGNNLLAGGGGNDLLRLQDGGNDSASGGAGNDVLYFGKAFTTADVANGGDGRDAIVLQGNYSLVLTGANLVGIESISIQSGANVKFGDTENNFYDFSIATADGNVAAGQQLIVNAQSLRAGEDFTFDGSAESDGKFLVYGGHGLDILKGGAGVDVFFFEGQRWTAGDKVDGGGGRDALVISAGSGTTRIEFAADSLTDIESISVNNHFATDPSQRPSYELVLHNGNVAAGGTLIVNGSSIPGGQVVNIDGRGVHDGSLVLFGGGGHDVLTGGDGADLIVGGAGADSVTGGAGADTFRYDSASDSIPGLSDLIGDFQSGVDRIDLSRIDANSEAAGDQAFSWIGADAFSGAAGELRVFEDNGYRRIEGDTNGDGIADFALVLQLGAATPVQADFLF